MVLHLLALTETWTWPENTKHFPYLWFIWWRRWKRLSNVKLLENHTAAACVQQKLV